MCDRFQRLHKFLQNTLANPSADAVPVAQLKLERARSAFLDFLDVPAKDQKQRDQLQKGSFTYVVSGSSYPASPALVKDILVLSDALKASEDLCASLVAWSISAKSRPGRSKAESGLLVFLDERTSLLLCLQEIWRGAMSADERVIASGLQKVFEREINDLTRGRGAEVELKQGGKAKGSWVEKVMGALEDCKTQADKLRASLRGPAPSVGALVPAGQGAAFPDETTEMRVQRYEEERVLIGQLLYFIGASRMAAKDDIHLLVRQLSASPLNDPAAVYLLTSLLSRLDTSSEIALADAYPLFTDKSFLSRMNTDLASSWTTPQLKAVVQLQWSLFLDAAARQIPNFETDGGEAVDNLTWAAIDAGVFPFLGRSVLAHKRDAEVDEIWGGIGADLQPLGGEVLVDIAFEDCVAEQIEALVIDVIVNRISILRKLRNREEDVVATSHRGGGLRSSRGGESQPAQPRHDLEAFFLLIATLYRRDPDGGLKFWEETAPEASTSAMVHSTSSRLSAFLRWGSECRPPAMMRAYYEMVASLASGPRSATYAYEFLSLDGSSHGGSSTCSWVALFGALEFYLSNLPDRPLEAGPTAEGAMGEMPPEEVPLLRSFIRLLRQVVAFSDVARATLHDNQRFRPIITLFALTGRSIPIELKASLLNAIEAFARPGGPFGVEVARKTWAALEQSQILPTWAPAPDARGGAGFAARSSAILRGPESLEGGIFTELEAVEAPNKVYPESTAFVQLLNTLIHIPSTDEPLSRRAVQLETNTIPDNLGAPNRAPGVDPYVHFVIDDVLLKAGQREYADPRERWKVTDVCLAFVEKCLASFDLGPFLAWAANGGRASAAGSPLQHLVQHPGFDILSRILGGTALLETVLTIVTAGYDSIRNNLAGTPLFTSCMLRCLRIIRRTLDIQAPFLEIALPALAESSVHIPQDKVGRLKALSPLDQSFLYHSEVVVQVALLVACDEDNEIALYAVQILALVAASPYFDVQQKFPEQSRTKMNRLVGLLQASPETLRIQEAFVVRLAEDVPESELETPEWKTSLDDTVTSAEKAANPDALRRAIRAAILDLFLAHTRQDRGSPNVAHLLLGFDLKARPDEMLIDDPEAANTVKTCLHVVLDLLAQNVSEDASEVQISVLSRHPTLASQCYRLVRQLCLQSYTSAAVSRYLRSREQFFLRQTLALPFSIPPAAYGSLGGIQFADGRQVLTATSAVCAVLHSEGELLESAALELSVLTTGNDGRPSGELVAALFETPSALADDMPNFLEQNGGLEQALPRMLEIFHSFDFAWTDALTPIEYRLNLFAELRFDSCLRRDATGCETYDFGAVLSLLNAARRELQNRGLLSTTAQQDEVKREQRAIVETLVVENHRREIQFARYRALKSWRNLLDIVLTKAFDLLPVESRHSLLLDLMSALLPPLAASEVDASISELLSGAAVLIATKLRDQGVGILFVDSGESVQSVPPERLHAVLRAVLQAILQPGVVPVVRGNLYAVLLNYIQYSAKVSALSPALSHTLDDTASIAGSTINDDVFSLDGVSTAGGTASGRRTNRRTALEQGNFAIFQSAMERLLPIVCRDAAVGHEVWRTVAFTVLDSLVGIAEEARATSKVLSLLVKHGYLQNFVTALKDADADLQATLQPDPPSLNALYVYEAQMSFLVRLASSREGAEKLLSAELLTRLAECEFLGARPVNDVSSMDFDGFIPPATERHHQLLLPALQLVVNTLVSFGADTTVATRQALAFISGQRENLLIALKDCASAQTVALLREAHLIVTLLSIVLPAVPEEDLATLSSFGGLHSALLALSAKICGPQDWVSRVLPSNEVERDEDQTLVLSLRNNATVFGDKVDTLVESVEAALLTYQSVATRKKAGTNAFRPVLLPTLRYGENAASGQSLGSMAAFLRDAAQVLSSRLQELDTLADLLDGFDNKPLDEVEAVFDFPAEDESEGDRRAKIAQELYALQTKCRIKLNSSLHILELALLQYWRHVSFYLDADRAAADSSASSRPDVGLGLAGSLKARKDPSLALSVSQFDLPSLREDLVNEFSRLGDRLTALQGQFSQKNVGATYRQREAFVGVIVRRLQELLLLGVEAQ
ncbi:Nup192p [Rhodotorula paludigena]|uniref:Nup192p n=1 Tax=Rhodotorula paludigena TaxID=86838 RepID=UPI003176E55B